MKSLVILLLAGLGLGGAYWLTQKPGASTDEMQAHLASTGNRLQRGFAAVMDNGEATLAARVDTESVQRVLGEEPTTIDERVAALSERIDAVSRQSDDLADLQSQSTSDIAAMEERMVSLLRRIDAAGGGDNAGSNSDALADAEAHIATLTKQHTAFEESLARLEAGLDRLNASSDGERLIELERQIAALKANTAGHTPSTGNKAKTKANADTSSSSNINTHTDTDNAVPTREKLLSRQLDKSVEYKIYFEPDSREINDAAAQVLDSLIVQEKNRTTGISIYGFTDRRGSASYNQRLALARATAVRSYLIQNGVEYKLIQQVAGLGEDSAATLIDDNAEDAEDAGQRMVMIFAAQP
ncbi:MAG: hypothetical protein CSB44_09650 [Gammaproteobacteria bacterium]|nr:MAG: hypothetical protein CSB44_09650 [Gammaproteobacteria bacterium]